MVFTHLPKSCYGFRLALQNIKRAQIFFNVFTFRNPPVSIRIPLNVFSAGYINISD